MSIFSEVGRILLEEASESEASSPVPKKPSHSSTHQPKAASPVTITHPSIEEEIYLDGEDMLRVVSISQVKNYTPPKPVIMDEEEPVETTSQTPEEASSELPDSETELEQELMRAFNETEETPISSPVSEETSEVIPPTEEISVTKKKSFLQKEVEFRPTGSTTSPINIEGDVIFPKGGSFTGTLHGNVSSKETLLLCGEVFGSVEAETLILQGIIHGTLQCQHLTLRNANITSLSKVEGAIRTESLSTEFI